MGYSTHWPCDEEDKWHPCNREMRESFHVRYHRLVVETTPVFYPPKPEQPPVQKTSTVIIKQTLKGTVERNIRGSVIKISINISGKPNIKVMYMSKTQYPAWSTCWINLDQIRHKKFCWEWSLFLSYYFSSIAIIQFESLAGGACTTTEQPMWKPSSSSD